MNRTKFSLVAVLFSITSILAPMGQATIKAQGGITRSAAEQRALKMINLTWTYSKDRNGVLDAGSTGIVTQPSQLNGINTAVMTGIPYDWGGSDSIDTSTYGTPWSNFLDAVDKGAYTGNTSSIGGIGYVNGTAGIDCSGFVQSVFNISGTKLSTSTLFNQYFKPIPLSDIKHMDILNYPGHHVVIFDSWGTKNGVQGAYTYEATTNQVFGGIQGTKRYFISLRAINNAYTPGRYINIIDDASVSKTGTMPQSSSSSAARQGNNTSATASNSVSNPQTGGNSVSSDNNASASNSTASSDPALSSSVNSGLKDGTVVSIETTSSGWCKVNYSDTVINMTDKFPNLVF